MTLAAARPHPYLPNLLRRVGLLRACALAPAFMVGMPLLVIALSWGEVNAEIWLHLAQTQLGRLLGNTLVLVLGVLDGAGPQKNNLASSTTAPSEPSRGTPPSACLPPLAPPFPHANWH